MTRMSVPLLAVVLLAAALAIAPRPASGAWPNGPTVNVPLCTLTYSQTQPASVADGAGGAIVTWTDARTGIGNWDIYAQRISAGGAVQWTADGVALCTVSNEQSRPTITSDGAGGAIVVWWDYRSGSGYDLYAQRISADGTVQWAVGGVALCTATGDQTYNTVAPDGAGGAIVAWHDPRAGASDIYVQQISAAGAVLWAANGVALCNATGSQTYPTLVADGTGGALVTWADPRNGNSDIYAQRISAAGEAQWTANGVALCNAAEDQSRPAITSDDAGGAVVTWHDFRSSVGYDIYAQRVSAAGAVQWTANGVALCNNSGEQSSPGIAPDGAGGAVVSWQDYRGGASYDVYAQKVSVGGAVQWTVNGVVLCAAPGNQQYVSIVPDGAGGAVVGWHDLRGGAGNQDIYAQRIRANGTPQWTADGLALCTATGDQSSPTVVSDGAGGAIVAWNDYRNANNDIYAQRVDRWGYSGAEPAIAVLRDVPNDQGGHMILAWDASLLDTGPPAPGVDQYFIWRQLPLTLALERLANGARLAGGDLRPAAAEDRLLRTAAANGQSYYWEYVATVTAYGMPGYSAVVPTAFDSIPGSNPLTWFMVQARSSADGHYWDSAPVSGYSVDNLAPVAPTPFTGEYAGGTTRMSWGSSAESDFLAYRLYRGNEPGFTPGPENLVAELTEHSLTDDAGAPYCYKLCAVDIHGNVSGFTLLLPSGTVDAPGPMLPPAVFLGPPAPNPVRGATTLRFGLPRAAHVELSLYDQQGRRVRRLLAGTQPAGERTIAWDGRDENGRALPAGLYFVRLASEGRTFVARLAVIR